MIPKKAHAIMEWLALSRVKELISFFWFGKLRSEIHCLIFKTSLSNRFVEEEREGDLMRFRWKGVQCIEECHCFWMLHNSDLPFELKYRMLHNSDLPFELKYQMIQIMMLVVCWSRRIIQLLLKAENWMVQSNIILLMQRKWLQWFIIFKFGDVIYPEQSL